MFFDLEFFQLKAPFKWNLPNHFLEKEDHLLKRHIFLLNHTFGGCIFIIFIIDLSRFTLPGSG